MATKQSPLKKQLPQPKSPPRKQLPQPKPTEGIGAKTPIDLVRSPQYDAAMAARRYDQMLADMTARARAGQFDPIREVVGNDFRASQGTQAGGGNQDFIDNRDPNKAYTMDMISYIDPSTGEITSRTSGIEPAPGSRFVRYYGPSPQGLGGGQQSTNPMDGYMPANPNAMAAYNQFLQRGQAMAGMYANQPAVTPTPSQMQAGSKSPQFAAQNFANVSAGIGGMQQGGMQQNGMRPPQFSQPTQQPAIRRQIQSGFQPQIRAF
ncbi:MAG: hypothetical protein EBR82_59645 [Caulobacteraceae bacterium]|nr:hypothetical protein [Caulobacteraceae bacterium]